MKEKVPGFFIPPRHICRGVKREAVGQEGLGPYGARVRIMD